MLKIGISPCPNDIFIFYGLLSRKVDQKGLELEFLIEDVETLNSLCLKGELDISKVSAHAYCYIDEEYELINSGGALSESGPVAVVRELNFLKEAQEIKIALPGRLTTASALMWFYWQKYMSPKRFSLKFSRYDKIYEMLMNQEVHIGVLIHEGRFTYKDSGFILFSDLGEFWRNQTGLPIPLGCVVMKKGLPIRETIESLIRESLNYALSNEDEAISFAKRFAQELSREVILLHIKTFVNDFTFDLGKTGVEAIGTLKNWLKREGLWELNPS